MIHVARSDNDVGQPAWTDVPQWSYTVGLFATWGHPEFVVFGLGDDIVHPLFWDLARHIGTGRTFEPGQVYENALPSFEGQTCAFDVVDSGWLAALFGVGLWFYKRQEFPILQYLWPDRGGRFVWDNGSRNEVRDVQLDLRNAPPGPDAPPPRR